MAIPTEKRMVTGLFRDRDSAEQAYRSVADRGYTSNDVNLVMSDETRKRHFSETGVLCPDSSRCVAKACRNVWQPTGFAMPARRVASLTARSRVFSWT